MRRAAALLLLLFVVACDNDKERRSREAALHQDLAEMRKAIAEFRADKKRGPHSLEELLRKIPIDPITQKPDWRTTTEEVVRNDDFGATSTAAPEVEVVDVHSRAPGKDLQGHPFADY